MATPTNMSEVDKIIEEYGQKYNSVYVPLAQSGKLSGKTVSDIQTGKIKNIGGVNVQYRDGGYYVADPSGKEVLAWKGGGGGATIISSILKAGLGTPSFAGTTSGTMESQRSQAASFYGVPYKSRIDMETEKANAVPVQTEAERQAQRNASGIPYNPTPLSAEPITTARPAVTADIPPAPIQPIPIAPPTPAPTPSASGPSLLDIYNARPDVQDDFAKRFPGQNATAQGTQANTALNDWYNQTGKAEGADMLAKGLIGGASTPAPTTSPTTPEAPSTGQNKSLVDVYNERPDVQNELNNRFPGVNPTVGGTPANTALNDWWNQYGQNENKDVTLVQPKSVTGTGSDGATGNLLSNEMNNRTKEPGVYDSIIKQLLDSITGNMNKPQTSFADEYKKMKESSNIGKYESQIGTFDEEISKSRDFLAEMKQSLQQGVNKESGRLAPMEIVTGRQGELSAQSGEKQSRLLDEIGTLERGRGTASDLYNKENQGIMDQLNLMSKDREAQQSGLSNNLSMLSSIKNLTKEDALDTQVVVSNGKNVLMNMQTGQPVADLGSVDPELKTFTEVANGVNYLITVDKSGKIVNKEALGSAYKETDESGGELTPYQEQQTAEKKQNEFYDATAQARKDLASGRSWGEVWSRIKGRFPEVPDNFIDQELGTQWREAGAYEKTKANSGREL